MAWSIYLLYQCFCLQANAFRRQLSTRMNHFEKLVRHRSRLNCTQPPSTHGNCGNFGLVVVGGLQKSMPSPLWALRKCRVKEAREREGGAAGQAYNYWGFYRVIGRPYIRGGRGRGRPRNRPRYAPVIAAAVHIRWDRGWGPPA